MSPERWRQIEELYHSALDRDPRERSAFLAQLDPELRGEIESLLAQESGEGILASTVAQVVSGTQLGPYRIEGPLGAGGMGEVFRARDTRLGRAVAIKIADHRFSDRFEREARAISSLNHPHICTLHDVGPNYLVMELVEGETLDARLKRGKLSLDDTLRYGAQIADAFAAAHAKGIVHRDLKPGNIMVTKSGVKVLDFGLAKSPQDETITASRVVMGTPAYMAPEQRAGKDCDARTDIYALGLILYEMATGQRLAPQQVPAMGSLPPQLAQVIECTLRPDPEDRWQSAQDLKAALGIITFSSPSVPTSQPRWIWFAVAALLALGVALGWIFVRRPEAPSAARAVRLDVSPPPGTEFKTDSGSAISPDGRWLVFVARSSAGDRLWLRSLNSSSARELPGTDSAIYPFWSPDSRSLAFFAAGKLKRLEVAGGLPVVICDVSSGRGGAWNKQGIILFNSVNDGPLLKVSANGGIPEPVTSLDRALHENSHRWPYFLPDGQSFLYFARGGPGESGVYLSSLDNPRKKTRLFSSEANAIYAPATDGGSGHLLWVRAGTLLAQPFDPLKGELSGEAVSLAEDVDAGEASRWGTASVSNEGTLFYGGAVHQRRQLTWFNRDGKVLTALAQPEAYSALRISPDGKRVALVRNRSVWQIEFARGIPSQIRTGDLAVVWTPDSARVAYSWSAPPNIFVQSVDSTVPEERLTESRDSQNPVDWTPDGKYLLYWGQSNDPYSKTKTAYWLMPMAGDRKSRVFMPSPFRQGRARFSPDGRWIAYVSDESGRKEVYVQSFPASGAKWQVSSKGGDYPIWRKDSGELFYATPDRQLMSVAIRRSPRGLEFDLPKTLFTVPILVAEEVRLAYTFDAAPDGQRFLALAPASEADVVSMTVITNWHATFAIPKNSSR